MINNIVTEVFNFDIYAYYLSTNRGTLVVYIAQTVYVLHHCNVASAPTYPQVKVKLDIWINKSTQRVAR